MKLQKIIHYIIIVIYSSSVVFSQENKKWNDLSLIEKNIFYSRIMSSIFTPYPEGEKVSEEAHLHCCKGNDLSRKAELSTGDTKQKLMEAAAREYQMAIFLDSGCFTALSALSGYYYTHKELDKWLSIKQKIIELYQDPKLKTRYLLNFASEWHRGTYQENLEKAEITYKKAIQVAPASTPELAFALEMIADFYSYSHKLRNDKLATQYYRKAIEVYKELYKNNYRIDYLLVFEEIWDGRPVDLNPREVYLDRIQYLYQEKLGETTKDIEIVRVLRGENHYTDKEKEYINKIRNIFKEVDTKNYDPKHICTGRRSWPSMKDNPFEQLGHYYLEKGFFKKAITLYEDLEKRETLKWKFRTYTPWEAEIIYLFSKYGRLEKIFQYEKGAIKCREYNKHIFLLPSLERLSSLYKEYFSAYRYQQFTQKGTDLRNIKKWYVKISPEEIELTEIQKKALKKVHLLAEKRFSLGRVIYKTRDNNHRLLLKLALPPLEENKILLAKIYLQCDTSTFSLYSCHRMLIPWDIKEVSWEYRNSKEKWKSSGGDYEKTPISLNPEFYTSENHIISFDITTLVKSWLKRQFPNYGVCIKEYEDENIFPRWGVDIYSKEGIMPIRVIIVFENETKPDIDGIVEYEEDWIDLYIHGMDGLLEKDLGKTIAYWTEAAKRTNDEGIKSKIKEHIKIVTDFIREQQSKTKN